VIVAARWRAAAGAGVVLSAALVLVAAWRAGERYAGAYALRTAGTVAAYLALVTPPPRDKGPGYDLAPLLVQARGLAAMPGLDADVEVYHGTAPLVHATAPSLAPRLFDRLRRSEALAWREGRALVPLRDRDGWDVVGAVTVRPRGVEAPLASPVLLVGLLIVVVAAWVAVRAVGGASRSALVGYAVAGLTFGVAAYVAVRGAARDSTDRWLADTRVLMQDVLARAPGGPVTPESLGRLAPGASLVPGRSAAVTPRRDRSGPRPAAVTVVRLGRGRLLEVRTLPAEALTRGWLVLLVALGLVGPAVTAGAHWSARAGAQPQRFRETATAWAFLAPAAAHLAVFALVPILFTVYLSVHRWSLADAGRSFVALGNFAEVLRDPLVWASLRNTALYALNVPATLALALAAALALHGVRRGVALVRTMLLIPAVSSVVAIALVWEWMYRAAFVGLSPVDWLGHPRTALLALMIVSAWVQVGYQTVVFLAGLQGIPRAYLDAARVDGANAWQRFWHVTFPLLRPVTLFVLVTSLIGAFQMFTFVYVLTEGGPLHATDVIVYRIYRTAWESLQFGHASALALLLGTILCGLTWAQFRLLGRRVEYA
jgi:multiple sugar transport system permease protein